MAGFEVIMISLRHQLQIYLLTAALAGLPAAAQRVPAKHPVSGRAIAQVMSAAGADWLERGERENEENPSKAVAMLGLKPGMTVCDLGAGTGLHPGLRGQLAAVRPRSPDPRARPRQPRRLAARPAA